MQTTRPEIGRAEAHAFRCWNFCGGWNPERMAAAFAYWRVEDADMVIGLMLEIRAYIAERADFERRVSALDRSTKH